MPTPVFQGVNFTNRRIPRVSEIAFSTYGNPFSSATEGGKFGMREATELDIKPTSSATADGKKALQAYEVAFKAALLQTDIDSLRKVYLLSKYPHNLLITTKQGDHYGFYDNTGPILAPTGTRSVGMKWKFSLSQKDRKIECEWGTSIYRTELAKLFADLGTMIAGPSATNPLALNIGTGLEYDIDKFIPAGITGVEINDALVGEISDAKIEAESDGDKNIIGQLFCYKVKLKFEVMMKQTSGAEGAAAVWAANKDNTIAFHTSNDEKIILTNCASTMPEFKAGDKENYIKISFEGEVSYNNDETAQESISFDAAGKELEFKFDTP